MIFWVMVLFSWWWVLTYCFHLSSAERVEAIFSFEMLVSTYQGMMYNNPGATIWIFIVMKTSDLIPTVFVWNISWCERFEVLTVVIVKIVLRDVMPCSLVDHYQCFRGHILWRQMQYILLKYLWWSTIIHDVTSQKRVIFCFDIMNI
jgi:hypothetical protein